MIFSFILTLLLFIPTYFFVPLRTPWYTIPISTLNAYMYLTNFPNYAIFFYKPTLTYNDLIDDTDPEHKQKYQKAFTRIQQVGGAIGIGLLVEYGYYAFQTNMTTIECIGVLGGLMSLYIRVYKQAGRYVLWLLVFLKKRNQKLGHTPSGLSSS